MNNLGDVFGLLSAQKGRQEKSGKKFLAEQPARMSDAMKLALIWLIAIALVLFFAVIAALLAEKNGGVKDAAAVAGALIGLLFGSGLLLWGFVSRRGKCRFCGSWRVKEVKVFSSGTVTYYDKECQRCGMSQSATPF